MELSNAEKMKKKEEDLQKDLRARINADNLPTANIMVAGKTGTGKSTLLNAIFKFGLDDENRAEVAAGRPVTSKIQDYCKEDIPIHIWDTVGLEIDAEKTKASIAAIKDTIAKKASKDDMYDRMHAIWYCIECAMGGRIENEEVKFIKELHSIGVPFIIVLTKCCGTKRNIAEFEQSVRDTLNEFQMNDIEIVKVLAEDWSIEYEDPITEEEKTIIKPAFGCDTLVDVTLDKLPDYIGRGFAAAQKVSQKQKHDACKAIIFDYVRATRNADWFNIINWDRVAIVNVFTTNRKIQGMFKKLGQMYSMVLKEDEIVQLIKDLGGIDIENGFWGLISPITNKFDDKVRIFFKDKEDGDAILETLSKDERSAKMIVFYGFTFVDGVEQTWNELTEAQLKQSEIVLRNLKAIIQEKLARAK